ncbi:MAG TPA: GlmU family protein [Cytophagaceae bacterium]|jgi:UDP-N-acetylglucosamine diphosphorylase/glucosamine-1-phosphate N-acetyltransferase
MASNYILFDDPEIRASLLPLTFTRPIAGIRTGIFTIAEKWEKHLNTSLSFLTESYLQEKFPIKKSKQSIYINGAVCPTPELVEAINSLKDDQILVKNNLTIAYTSDEKGKRSTFKGDLNIIQNPWDIFVYNPAEIKSDFDFILSLKKKSQPITDPHTIAYNPENIFLEEGVKLRACILNAEEGPIYLGKNSEVQEGAIIKGPFALCESAVVNMGAKMRGDSTIGPFSKVGGEVSNSVIFGYSNKGHDGFMGNTVIGEWCNLGADTNTSNLKNNYGTVEVFNYKEKEMVSTGRQFCGLIMGDHAKSGINTMFNTGTVVGVAANIFGSGFPPKHIPSFSWGGAEGFTTFRLEKAFEVAQRVMERRKIKFTEIEKNILEEIFDQEVNVKTDGEHF